MRILAWSVDVGVAQGRVGNPVLDTVKVQVALCGKLRDPIGRDGILWMVLGRGNLSLLPVDRPAGRGKDDFAYPLLYTALQQMNRSDDINIGVEVWFPN